MSRRHDTLCRPTVRNLSTHTHTYIHTHSTHTYTTHTHSPVRGLQVSDGFESLLVESSEQKTYNGKHLVLWWKAREVNADFLLAAGRQEVRRYSSSELLASSVTPALQTTKLIHSNGPTVGSGFAHRSKINPHTFFTSRSILENCTVDQ